jgi:hypothetical protein
MEVRAMKLKAMCAFLFGMLTSLFIVPLASANPSIVVQCLTEHVEVNEEFTVQINIQNAPDLHKALFAVEYDSSLLRVTEVSPGGVFGENPAFFKMLDEGTVRIFTAKPVSSNGEAGEGSTLATVRYQAIDEGRTTVSIGADVLLETRNHNEPISGFEDLVKTPCVIIIGFLETVLNIEPPESHVMVGQEITLEAAIRDVRDLYGASFEIEYDSTILEHLHTELGDFMGEALLPMIVPQENVISVGATMIPGMTPASGSGIIAVMTFKGRAKGTSRISYRMSKLKLDRPEGSTQKSIQSTVVDGIVNVHHVGLTIPELLAMPGDTISVPLDIDDAIGIYGADIAVIYDADLLEAIDVKPTSLFSGANTVPNLDDPGRVVLAMASADPIAVDSGALVEIIFRVANEAVIDTVVPLEFEEAIVYDEPGALLPVNIQNGRLTIGELCIKGDVNGDGLVRVSDAILALNIATGRIATPREKCAADVNNDGMVRSNDAVIILHRASGRMTPAPGSIVDSDGQIAITLFQPCGSAGQVVPVPLMVDNARGLAGGDISISYDSGLLRVVGVSSTSDALLASNVAEPGVVQIAYASADHVNSRTLANIEFQILVDDSSPLILKDVELYTRDGSPLSFRVIDGKFRSLIIAPECDAVFQNYPNPFNPDTWIPYQLSDGGKVTIRIFKVSGELVREFELGYREPGVYITPGRAAYWDGKDKSGLEVASGTYFFSFDANGFSGVRKMTILK